MLSSEAWWNLECLRPFEHRWKKKEKKNVNGNNKSNIYKNIFHTYVRRKIIYKKIALFIFRFSTYLRNVKAASSVLSGILQWWKSRFEVLVFFMCFFPRFMIDIRNIIGLYLQISKDLEFYTVPEVKNILTGNCF